MYEIGREAGEGEEEGIVLVPLLRRVSGCVVAICPDRRRVNALSGCLYANRIWRGDQLITKGAIGLDDS